MTPEIRNAVIVKTRLGREAHGIFTAMLDLDYGGSGQSFGGYNFDNYDDGWKKRIGTAHGMHFIIKILETLEVSCWEALEGTHCRVECDNTRIQGIGHIIKDRWFHPKADPVLLGRPPVL